MEGVTNVFFLVMGIPILIIIAVIYAYLNDLPLPRPTENNSYWSLLRDRRLMLPLSASLAVGILFGFVYSFIALWLNKASMPMSWFFT